MLITKRTGIVTIIVVILALCGIYLYATHANKVENVGAISGQLIEDNIPYFRNNGGLLTGLPIQASSTVTISGAGSALVTANATITNATSTGSFAIGSSGTGLGNVAAGLCYIDPYAATIAASTTANVDCQGTLNADASGSSALTGIVNGDNIIAQLASTTAGSTVAGISIIGSSASTTAGHIVLRISNLTGTTYTWSTTLGQASGTASYIDFR